MITTLKNIRLCTDKCKMISYIKNKKCSPSEIVFFEKVLKILCLNKMLNYRYKFFFRDFHSTYFTK